MQKICILPFYFSLALVFLVEPFIFGIEGGIQMFTILIFPMTRWKKLYLISIFGLLLAEGFDVCSVLFSAGCPLIRNKILTANKINRCRAELAWDFIHISFFP